MRKLITLLFTMLVSFSAMNASITVKMRIANNYLDDGATGIITWTDVRFYAWNASGAIGFMIPTQEGEWYSYTFDESSIGIVFVNGNTWPTHTPYQSKDVTNITTSGCYEVGDIDKSGDWKRLVTAVSCDGSGPNPTDPITIKMKIVDNNVVDKDGKTITWTNVKFYAWTDGSDGAFYTPAQEGGEWYSYTFTRKEFVNVIFTHLNSDDTWMGHTPYQTKNIEHITASSCYEVGNIDDEGDGDWKRFVTSVDCSNVSIKTVQTQPVSIYTDNNIIRASFDGRAQIALYAVTGQLLCSTTAENQFAYPVSQGIYLLRIDGKAFKVLVR